MKKYAFLITVSLILVGLSFANYNSSKPPIPLEDYSVTVTWNDGGCNCGTIVSKELDIEVWDLYSDYPDPTLIDYEYGIDITSVSSYLYEETGNIIWNCQDCYQVRIKVYYYDGEGLCCYGANSETCDGEDLINGYPISCTLE
jgi:hypothetical protein